VVTDNVVTGAGTGLRLFTPGATVRRNTFSANRVGIEVTDVSGHVTVIGTNNFLGNAGASGNCGVLNQSIVPLAVTGNFWGSASGPGAPPADTVCGNPAVSTPFLRAPVTVTAPAGR
jgi:nitrous oxidase accessory protein NosD